jgi:amino acid permease
MERKKTGARELGLALTAIGTAMVFWAIYTNNEGAIGLIHTYVVSTFAFITTAFIKAAVENYKTDELEASLPPEAEPDPVPPQGFGE